MGDELLRFERRHAKIHDKIFARKAINSVFKVLNPIEKCGALFGRNAGGLMGEIRSDVAISENDLAVVQSGFEFRLGFEAVAGVEHGSEVRVDGLERAKFAIEELPDHFAEPGIVLRKAGGIDGMAARAKGIGEQIDLGALAAAIDAFDGDEFSESGHFSK